MSSDEAGLAGFVSVRLIYEPKDANGESQSCADVFLIPGPSLESNSTWTDQESGTFWPRDLLSKDTVLKESCRVWALVMEDLHKDPELRSFQDCIVLQKFAAGSMNAIDRTITSAGGAEKDDDGKPVEKRPNNGVVILMGHGLGGILAQAIASFCLELSSEALQGHHLGLKQIHWRLVLLGTPHLLASGNILDDVDQIQAIVTYYGGRLYDVHHTRGFWKGLQQHSLCLIDGDWEAHQLNAPLEAHGTLKVASFREGEEDRELAELMKHVVRPNDPDTNGFVVQQDYALFGGKAWYGFSMSGSPSPVLPGIHKAMGQFKDLDDPGYLALRTVLNEFVRKVDD